jgi:hypothetical protein
MIEEPECFLHPSAQAEFGRILRDLAEEFQVQVIITTHRLGWSTWWRLQAGWRTAPKRRQNDGRGRRWPAWSAWG